MPSNSEMYERGALDAEHDDLNAFYYQHYYYYRRGYNDTRRQRRGGVFALRPALGWLLAALALALVGGTYWLLPRGEAGSAAVATAVSITAAPQATAQPAALILTPTPMPAPTPAPALRVGGRARVVNVGDSTLRARADAGLAEAIRVVARFPQGSVVTIVEGPKDADGLVWWRISGEAGEGWSAERSPEGVVFLEPLP
jgi:hypothetical protein